VPEITDAVSWVATERAGAGDSAAGRIERRNRADDFPPPAPEDEQARPSGIACALDIGVGSPLPTA